ncbi:MAG TPA: WecB/TagA/CpsF family glycosyltransferase [Chthonomonadaceae bacterium]|nr:WecB/TagA/CpsF family glycosyltransferase [Chthonomonadaceae bacterium]
MSPVLPLKPNPLPAISILGLPVHDVDMDAALAQIDRFIGSGTPHHIITADSSMLVMAQEDAQLRSLVAAADLVTPDSAGILWAAKQVGTPLRERVSGVEIVERLCALSPERGYRLYFLGAAEGVAEQAAARMQARYPGAQIVGTHHGFFGPGEMEAVLEDIRCQQPDVLCVAMGIPKQEKWIAAHREELGVPVLIGVGGTFDVLSGRTRRAPAWMQKFHLEWLWRVLVNPRKINKVLLLPRFVRLVRQEQKQATLDGRQHRNR